MSTWNDTAIAEFRGNNGSTGRWGDNLVIMHTIGAKTGEERLAPVMGLPDGDGWLVIASKGGAPTHPAWYYNLVANPEFDIEARVDGAVATVPVTARELDGTEYAGGWERLVARAAAFAAYAEKTQDRRMPIFHLAPR